MDGLLGGVLLFLSISSMFEDTARSSRSDFLGVSDGGDDALGIDWRADNKMLWLSALVGVEVVMYLELMSSVE